MKHLTRILAVPTAALLVASWIAPAFAEPPPWAPAHGYRAKKGKAPPQAASLPFGIDLGRCNREQLGQVLGGVIGAAAGATVRGDDRPIAIVAGTVIGVLIGGYIGRRMDEVDQYCVAQALEYAEAGQTIAWRDQTGAEYRVTPRAAQRTASGQYCREYQTVIRIGGKQEQAYGTACRSGDGAWKKVE